MGVLTYCKVLFITAATTYPFAGLVSQLSDLQPDRFMPCNEHTCSLVKLFADEGSNSTFDFGDEWTLVNPFHMVRNGEGFDDSAPTGFPPPLCPGVQEHEMRERCADRAIAARLVNPLKHSKAKLVYMWGVFGWFLFKILHDWMLLGGCTEYVTLRVGLVSVLCQFIAVASGFLWCMGAAEVFIAHVPDHNCACYYELPENEVLLAIGTPSLLFALLVSKMDAVRRAVVHGDYLYFTQYDVPYQIVAASVPDPSGSLLVCTVAGRKTADPRQGMTTEQLAVVVRAMIAMGLLCLWIGGPCVGLAIGPLTARLMGLTIRFAAGKDNFVWHVAIVVVVLFLIFMLIFHASLIFDGRMWNFKKRKCGDVFLQWSWFTRSRLIVTGSALSLMQAYAMMVLIIPLGNAALGKNVEDDSWSRVHWALAGLVVFSAGVIPIINHMGRPTRIAMWIATRSPLIPPSEYVYVARRHAEFGLTYEGRIAQAFLDRRGARSPTGDTEEWLSDWKAALDASRRRGSVPREDVGQDHFGKLDDLEAYPSLSSSSESSDACSSLARSVSD